VGVLPSRVRWLIAATLLAGLALATIGCHQAEKIRAQAVADSRAVTFRAPGGSRLSGRLFGPDSASAGVVLSHMAASDQSAWLDFADRLGVAGYRVLTFDFPGTCPGGEGGCSNGTASPQTAWQDVAAAASYLRSVGVSRIGLVGAGLGGSASLVAASQPSSNVAVVITLSATADADGIAVGPEVFQTVTAAKLFLAGDADTLAADSAQAFYDASLPPKEVELLTSADHGTDLLIGSQGEKTRNLILGYLDRYLPVSPASSTP
jgi:dienelactone hydrolase